MRVKCRECDREYDTDCDMTFDYDGCTDVNRIGTIEMMTCKCGQEIRVERVYRLCTTSVSGADATEDDE